MRAKTIQVVWHGKEPVYSVDFHPDGTLFTAGGDKEIKAWKVVRCEDGYAGVSHVSTLRGHSKTVNCVRFSPSGGHLVSSGDGGEMLLWALAEPAAPRGNLCADEGSSGWRRAALMRGHTDDVMDLSWSADGSALLSGSIDNKAIAWEVSEKRRGQIVAQFANHKHFVQGVAWDPAQQFVVTQSADRTCRVYALRPPAAGRRNKVSQYLQPACDSAKELYCAHILSKRVVAPPPPAAGETAAAAKPERHPLFQDETVPSFFRRLAWSPDGSFLVVPAGTHRATAQRDVNTAFVYARGKWAAPVAHLPAQSKPVVAVRFCPVVFRRDEPSSGPPPFADLPYKLVFAVATLDSVVVYDTASALPLAVLGQLHYDSITDLAWSRDARYLAVASRDCYCSIASFEAGELGTPAVPEDLPPHIAKRVFAAAGPVAGDGALPAAAQPATEAAAQPAVAAAAPAAVVAPAAGASNLQAEPPQDAKAVRCIQAEPVGGEASAKRAKRIVPEEIGPLSAVVSDTQAGNAFRSAAKQPPAAKKPKHITTAAIQPLAPAAVAQPSGDVAAATKADAASTSISRQNSGSGTKGAKRITPTNIAPAGGGVQERFEHAKQASSAASVDQSHEVRGGDVAPSKARRITPILLATAQPLPGAKAPALQPSPSPAKGFSIAALALAAGQKAAMQAKKE